MITANRINSLRATMLANINKRLSLYMVDKDEYKSMQGYQAPIQSPIPGRGQIELEEILDFQAYLPTKQADVLASVKELRKLAETMSDDWTGDLPAKVPMLPKIISTKFLFKNKKVQAMREKSEFPIGFDKESAEVVGYIPKQTKYFMALSDTPEQDEYFENTILENFRYLKGKVKTIVFDLSGKYTEQTDIFDNVIGVDDIGMMVKKLGSEIEKRVVTGDHRPIYIYIPEAEQLAQKIMLSVDDLQVLLQKGYLVGIHLIFSADQKAMSSGFQDISKLLRNSIPAGLIGSKLSDQNLIKVTSSYREPFVGQDESNLFIGREVTKVKLASEVD